MVYSVLHIISRAIFCGPSIKMHSSEALQKLVPYVKYVGLCDVYKVLHVVCVIAYFMQVCFCLGLSFKV